MVDIATSADVDIKQKTDEVMDVARSVLEGGLGLHVGKVQIKIDQMKPPKKGLTPIPKMGLPKLISAKQEEANEEAAKSLTHDRRACSPRDCSKPIRANSRRMENAR